MARNLLEMQDVALNSKVLVCLLYRDSGGPKDGVRRDKDAGLVDFGGGRARDAEPPRVAGEIGSTTR